MKRIIILLSIGMASCSTSKESSSNDSSAVKADSGAMASNSDKTGSYCFLEAIGKDSTIVTFAINGNTVEGEMKWLPYEKDGAIGTLKGTITGETINAEYDYVIEGSQQQEEKIFKLEGDKLIELSGELEDKNGKMVIKEPSKATPVATLKKVNCLDISHE